MKAAMYAVIAKRGRRFYSVNNLDSRGAVKHVRNDVVCYLCKMFHLIKSYEIDQNVKFYRVNSNFINHSMVVALKLSYCVLFTIRPTIEYCSNSYTTPVAGADSSEIQNIT